MKYRITHFLIVIIAMMLPSFLKANTKYFYVINDLQSSVHIERTSHYCADHTTPEVLDLPPHGTSRIEVEFDSYMFHECGYYHSSQNFRATTVNTKGVLLTFEFQWYKPHGADSEIRILKNPGNIISVNSVEDSYDFDYDLPENHSYIYFNRHSESLFLD